MRQELADSLAEKVTAVRGWKAWIVPIPGASRSGPVEYEVRVQRTGLDEIPLRSLADWLDIQQRLARLHPSLLPLPASPAAPTDPTAPTQSLEGAS